MFTLAGRFSSRELDRLGIFLVCSWVVASSLPMFSSPYCGFQAAQNSFLYDGIFETLLRM
jgi:hypothetical protein